jgi:hypothetical protein
MNFWLDLTASPTSDGQFYNGTPAYLEIQVHQTDQPRGISYTYIIPLDNSNFIAAACWGHEFDRFQEFIFHQKLGGDWIKAYSEAWPTFGELINNALQGHYSRGALVNFEDPDDGERKWCVVTYAGNTLPKANYEEVTSDERIKNAVQLVATKSLQLSEQMTSGRDMSPVTKAKMLAKGAFLGYRQAINTQLIWLDRLSKIASVAGG